ncbi:MAG: acetylornithine deacetylase [Archangium sp.]|nr:acetylornithine deacetylase [Archangium sp.]
MSQALVSLLAELVGIDSTSTLTNRPLVQVLRRRLEAAGFSCDEVMYSDAAGVEKVNLVATSGAGLPELALVGHTDCVPYDVEWKEALTLTERGGMLYGRGACDTKSFIACAVIAAERTKGARTKALRLVFTADEELGCLGAKKLVEVQKGHAKRAIVGEPTSLRPIRANKGYCLAEVEVHGKEGHSAYPETGVSAVFQAARLLNRLEAFSLGALRVKRDEAFVPPFTTLNVGLLSGGRAKNVIPGACRFTLEWRPLPGQATEVVLREVQQLCAALTAETNGAFKATVKPLRMDRGFSTPPEADVVQFLSAASGRAPDTVAFGTEGPQLAALGATPVVFGPGDITVAHQTGEHVPVNELHRAAEVLEAAV